MKYEETEMYRLGEYYIELGALLKCKDSTIGDFVNFALKHKLEIFFDMKDTDHDQVNRFLRALIVNKKSQKQHCK